MGQILLRPLSAKGRGQAARLGAFLLRAEIRPDRLISSPKVRALQTAQAIGTALDLPVTVDDRLAAGCSLDRLDDIVAQSGAHVPMLFGHDPDFSVLVSDLLGARGIAMRKGALATIEVRRPLAVGEGNLRWLVPPEIL